MRDWPVQMLWQAWKAAVSDDEHAVSIAMLGPRRSNWYEMRLATIAKPTPPPVCVSMRR